MATTATTISEQEYRELAFNDDQTKWELWDGVLVEKPPMSMRHDNVATYMGLALANQLDPAEFLVRTTGDYDMAAKLPVYQQRGDLEIWFYHPYEQRLIVQRRQSDGSYSEEHYTGGIVSIHSLPGVTIDLDALPGGKNWAGQP
ncbi:MAG: putative restriction endonuclease [Thermomicrobiales bacterium]|nr:putative restriction endonuclease [Thermomicrobiales bacterium]